MSVYFHDRGEIKIQSFTIDQAEDIIELIYSVDNPLKNNLLLEKIKTKCGMKLIPYDHFFGNFQNKILVYLFLIELVKLSKIDDDDEEYLTRFLKKINSNKNDTSVDILKKKLGKLITILNGYRLCLKPEKPVDILKSGKIYLEIKNDQIKYQTLFTQNQACAVLKKSDFLQNSKFYEELKSKIEKKNLSEISSECKAEFLKITSKREHTILNNAKYKHLKDFRDREIAHITSKEIDMKPSDFTELYNMISDIKSSINCIWHNYISYLYNEKSSFIFEESTLTEENLLSKIEKEKNPIIQELFYILEDLQCINNIKNIHNNVFISNCEKEGDVFNQNEVKNKYLQEIEKALSPFLGEKVLLLIKDFSMENGEKIKATQIAKNLKSEGLDIEFILKTTGIDLSGER